MELALDISLDPTLGCGQAHRWRKIGDSWEGVIGNDVISLMQTDGGVSVDGSDDASSILHYLGADDDLDGIISEISEKDPYVASLASRCPGLRILRQEPWECTATYLLATNANVKRIASMVESVCVTFGRDLGGRSSFPTPKEILDKRESIGSCRLGFREPRLIELAENVENGEHDPYSLCGL
ncbi:MAG: 8-oxoguanine DNA glycosylase, N-terminal domain-containing protein, partial [Candidatus Methanomethylophilaceae archaeon]|nr:8-oxoguanine DNA glycosylase, N-terminal domain-containing protein [Candidatus Methanomethylophilaceae archaeon]